MNGALMAWMRNAARLTLGHVDELFQLRYHGCQGFRLVARRNYIFQSILPMLYLFKSSIAEAVVC